MPADTPLMPSFAISILIFRRHFTSHFVRQDYQPFRRRFSFSPTFDAYRRLLSGH
jgi:hypothetical protein